ncbi:putative long-chain-alcohol O-fatty-acyltransferase 5 [Heracleum sosnowskyi]|uniref:Long-chain-alcohol O-fatty-acyltransferase 5 n=1 Tax=Heracleum sosnowskyi TaxID=360622 RepID=A0AAD8IX10_9APIA|nr:putative long-chain-alcohol O-fatty-acyltransferase 5 [Heracleum sosnowskyi]
MEGEIKNLSYVYSLVIASLCYCYFVSSKISPGKLRFISVFPIFCLFTILPYYLSSAFNTALLTFFITWLSNFKLLLFCFGHGPLSSHIHSFSFFISVACLPIRIKQSTTSTNTATKALPLNVSIQILGFAILVKVLCSYREGLHQKIIQCLYCFLCFLLIDILIALSSTLVRALVGVELEPASNEPYLSTSLQDFWGKRWNLTVTTTLRDTVYKPVRKAIERVIGKDLAPVTAVIAAFLVSGLMHELLFYNVTRVYPTWETTLFFVLHGICVVVEVWLKKWVQGRGWQLPLVVSTGLTVGFVVGTSLWLFFPPLIRNGADTRVLEEMTFFAKLIWSRLTNIFWSIYK